MNLAHSNTVICHTALNVNYIFVKGIHSVVMKTVLGMLVSWYTCPGPIEPLDCKVVLC